MNKRNIAGTVLGGVLALGGIAACGTNHDAPNPVVDIRPAHWWRVETPPGFATPMFGCVGRDGYVLDPDGNITVTPLDPECPVKGEPYLVVRRIADQPPVILGTYNVPPDLTGRTR